MHITKVVTKNYRCLRDRTTDLHADLNVIVGNNESGKSTLLEAIHLALTGQLNGRPLAAELHPHLFNQITVREYVEALRAGHPASPPAILIELYFADSLELAPCKGINNSRRENAPGIKLSIEFNEDYKAEYAEYVSDPTLIRTVPIEYYAIRLRTFADNDITPRAIPIKPSLIDASTIRNNSSASRYVVDIMKDSLARRDQVDLALSFRLLRDRFLNDSKVAAVNAELARKKGRISDKTLSVSLDTSARTSWETGVMPQLDDIPMPLVGKGEQNTVKIKLALETSAESHVVLIEEAENHLSHSNLNALINHISSIRGDRQLLITTHSSFVLNKLGIDTVLLFGATESVTLKQLTQGTQDYFVKLPGHDTLRLILAKRAILVEGPSDELVLQGAFRRKHGKLPIEAGIDVISVRSLAFKRFLEIAALLGTRTDVITDNDGNIDALKRKYAEFARNPNIRICYDEDINSRTLEPQLLKANGRIALNRVLDRNFQTDADLLAYMEANKTDVAFRLFENYEAWSVPAYIEAAIG